MLSCPSIPERTGSSTKVFKRLSLPASPHNEDRRRHANRAIVKPASSEVISSLIDTLSAISTPVEKHFDTFPDIHSPQSTPVSPAASVTGLYGTRRISKDNNASLRVGDLETARDSLSALVSSTKRASRRGSHVRSSKKAEDESSIGNVSVERQPRLSSASLISMGSSDKGKSLKSFRSLKNLGQKSSKESFDLPSVLVDGKHKQRMAEEWVTTPHSRSPSPESIKLEIFKQRSHLEQRFHPNEYPEARKKFPVARFEAENMSHSTRKSQVWDTNGQRDAIPTRTSSMRHRRDPSMRHSMASLDYESKSIGHHSDQAKPQTEESARKSDEFSTLVSPAPSRTRPIGTNSVEEGVTRRIKELKEQKEERERILLEEEPDHLLIPTTRPRTLPQTEVPVVPTWQTIESPGIVNCNPESEQPEFEVLDEHSSVPPPAISTSPLRTGRNHLSRPGTETSRGSMPRNASASDRDENRSASLTMPKRHHSRLQKRLSINGGSIVNEKQRRRISTPLSLSTRQSSYQPDGLDPVDNAVLDYLSASRLSQTVECAKTGRVISFSEVGDPNGSVVFCCVGMGLTRYVTAFYDELAATLKLRLITPDRPGVGGSGTYPDATDTPLGWPDDIRTICEKLRITKFSILAHSAGAIYALATALRMPQHIRCRVHLLAPWIPPSQMLVIGSHQEPLPSTAMPYSQRFLRSLPTPFLRVANSNFLSITSNRISTSLPGSPRRYKRTVADNDTNATDPTESSIVDIVQDQRLGDKPPLNRRGTSAFDNIVTDSRPELRGTLVPSPTNTPGKEKKDVRQSEYTSRLTEAIWTAATTNANAAVDLIVCLERRQPIGFRYVDITRAVVIHHGSKDTRVPLENVKWLGNMMRRCEVRVLDGEGHGLMASAAVMGNVLMEMSKEWEDWMSVVKGRRHERRT